MSDSAASAPASNNTSSNATSSASANPLPRPNYTIPHGLFLSVSSSIFFHWPSRVLAIDAPNLLNTHIPRPLMTGQENIPRTGPVLFVANHHHRANMWIGWCGSMLIEAVNQIRPARAPLHIVVANLQRMRWRHGKEVVIPTSKFFLRRVAEEWDMIQIPGEAEDTIGQAAALRKVLTLLKQDRPVLLFPEGEIGSAYTLVQAKPGTGTFIALASRRAPIVPVAFWEEGEQLRGHIAPAITINGTDDNAIREQVMTAIGVMVPEPMWGPYRESIRAKAGQAG